MNKLLIIDDEWNLRNLIKIYLSGNPDYSVKEAETGLEGLYLIEKEAFDLVILDIMLPEMDGWEVCRHIRNLSDIPILMLTARSDVADRVKGLQLGADDYLLKPFASEELLARIEALLRRRKQRENDDNKYIHHGPLLLNLEEHQCSIHGKIIDLTKKEFDLLLLMARFPQKIFTREHLLNVLWVEALDREERTVDTHIKNIRLKVAKIDPSHFNPIKTIRGVGYKIGEVNET